jgi:small subunit ribosomal protein S8
MVLNDPLANALSKIMNLEKVSKKECIITPSNKIIKQVLKIFQEHNYIGEMEEIETNRGIMFKVHLLNKINKCGVIKPNFSIKKEDYERFEKRYLPARNVGLMIITTSQGIVVHTQAKKNKIGGKLLAYCY